MQRAKEIDKTLWGFNAIKALLQRIVMQFFDLRYCMAAAAFLVMVARICQLVGLNSKFCISYLVQGLFTCEAFGKGNGVTRPVNKDVSSWFGSNEDGYSSPPFWARLQKCEFFARYSVIWPGLFGGFLKAGSVVRGVVRLCKTLRAFNVIFK